MSDAVYGLRTAVFRLTTLYLPDFCRIDLTHIARAVAFFEGQGGPSALLSVASQQFANHPLSPPSPLTISKIAPCKIRQTKRKWRHTMSGKAVLENVRRYRTIASLYRQTAAFRPDQKWSLLAQAFEYERLARTELERSFTVRYTTVAA